MMNDPAWRIVLKLMLLAAIGTGCAQEDGAIPENRSSERVGAKAVETATAVAGRRTVLLAGGSEVLVFVPTEGENGEASLVAMTDGDAGLRYRRIIRILREVKADTAFIEKIAPRLKNNRRLKKEDFTLPLIDEKGNEHHIEYISDFENTFVYAQLRVSAGG